MANPSCAECPADVATIQVNETESVHTEKKTYDALDPSTFAPPPLLPPAHITIQFCNRCRWLHRATWISTELFLTFPPSILHGVHIVPSEAEETAGIFRVWLSRSNASSDANGGSAVPNDVQLVWDRKIEGGFPELKVLKQRIRDHLQPEMALGHSDKAHAISASNEESSMAKGESDAGGKEAQ